MKFVPFKFWITLEFSQRHCNRKTKRFDFSIEYKPSDRTCPFQYQRLELFGLQEEIGIKSSVAFLKYFSIVILCQKLISIPTPEFPHFYYILGANLGSLLHGDVSVALFPENRNSIP